MLNLIVHADDLGLSESVNEGIVQAHLNGVVTSASVMANGMAFEHAVRLCQSIPTLDVGIHLTLVGEKPLTKPDHVLSLMGSRGRLHHHATSFMKNYITGRIRIAEVQAELEAQIKAVLSRGLEVSHLDGHQHLHVLPQILNVTLKLASKYKIPGIRLPFERPRFYMARRVNGASRFLQLLSLNAFCQLAKKKCAPWTDSFVGFYFAGNLNKSNLRTVLENLPRRGTCELMCHPGIDDPATRYGEWGYHWSDELEALLDPRITDWIREKGIHLISYREHFNKTHSCDGVLH